MKTFSLDYDTRSSNTPIIVVNYHGLVFRMYLYTSYENIADIDLTADEVTYTYNAPQIDDCSISWTREKCWFTFSYHEDDPDGRVCGGGTDLTIPLTPESHKELCDVFRELQHYNKMYCDSDSE